MLADFGDRLRDFHAFYSPTGLFPVPFAPLVFALGMLAATAVILGFASRIALLVVWGALGVLHHYAPLLLDSSDDLMRAMALLMVFAVRKDGVTPPLALFALQAQVMFVHLYAGLAKSGSMWRDGTAVSHVLQLETFARPWTQGLLHYPALCKALTWSTLAIELMFAPLVFASMPWLAITGALLLHLGIFAALKVGTFSLIMPLSLMLFAPVRFVRSVRTPLVPVALAALLFVQLRDRTWSMFAPNPAHFKLSISARADTGEDVLLEGLRENTAFAYTRWAKLKHNLMGNAAPSVFGGLARQMCWRHPEVNSLRIGVRAEPTRTPDGAPSGPEYDQTVWSQPCR